jgi:transcriptional regulator with XRE-family HTH domain
MTSTLTFGWSYYMTSLSSKGPHVSSIALKVRDLSERAHLSQEDVGRIVGASGRTVARWAAGVTPHRSARERLLELSYVADQLIEVLGLSPDDANLWIFSPNRLLKGDKPADRIADGDYRSVLGLIDALADGIVA